jgi:hypothetical protein
MVVSVLETIWRSFTAEGGVVSPPDPPGEAGSSLPQAGRIRMNRIRAVPGNFMGIPPGKNECNNMMN